MNEKIDYLALERRTHNEGSINDMIKKMVVAIRYIRERVPATEISTYTPSIRQLEKDLHSEDDSIGRNRRSYFDEIWDALDNEPQSDDSICYSVCVFSTNGSNEIVLSPTGNIFPHRIIAEEWIKESEEKNVQYTILEIIQP